MTKTRLNRLKRKTLRGAVEENLRTIQGLPPDAVRPWPRRFAILRRRLPMMLLPFALLGSLWFGQGFSETWHSPDLELSLPLPSTAAPQPATAPGEVFLTSEAFAAEAAVLPAPRRLVDPSVFPLAVRRVVVDAGHGGYQGGTTLPDGIAEKEITLDVAQRLRNLLKRDGFEVVMTRDRDEYVALEERTRIANRASADIFVSIHVNWFEGKTSRGVETYFLGAADAPYLNELAASENRDSGYSVADLQRLLEGIYANARKDESAKLASSVQESLYGSLKRANPKLQDRGVKRAPFVVLVSTRMPAILAEVSCLSNQEEAALLSTPEYRQRIAQALFLGVHGYIETRATPPAQQQAALDPPARKAPHL